MKEYHHISLWDEDKVSTLLAGIHLAPGSAEYEELSNQPSSSPSKEHCAIGLPMFRPSLPSNQLGMKCSYCKATFADREEQVSHYRLDWHRNNLRRSIEGKIPLTEEQFMEESSDMSSISGSEDSGDDGEEEEEGRNIILTDMNAPVLKRQARLFFLNADGYVISLFRNVLYSKSVEIDGEQDVIQRTLAAPRKKNWAILLLGGGHFAGAVFRGKEVILHKTFHNYTVRAKHGGSQGNKDNQIGAVHPNSSGASLRRYNEQSQRQHVQALMGNWKTHLDQCDLIFYHAKHHNIPTFFGGKQPVLLKNDERLRRIPFSTKRAKFSEVKRIFGLLSEIFVHGKEEEFNAMVREAKIGNVQPTISQKKMNKSNNSRTVERKLKTEKYTLDLFHEESTSESPAESDKEMELVTQFSTFVTSDLGGQHCSVKSKSKKNVSSPSSKKLNEKSRRQSYGKEKKGNKGCPHKTKVWDLLHRACKSGNIDQLSLALKISPVSQKDNTLSQDVLESIANVDIPADLSKITFGSMSQTMLHVAAENGKSDVLWWLLEHGCNPGITDSSKRTPFDASVDKECRNTFRRFMAQWPDKYDFKKAKIPSPLTREQEEEQAAKLALRRKAQRQAKLERKREKKLQERIKLEQEKVLEIEEEERKIFLSLSDREKRALAAECRFQQQQQHQQDQVQGPVVRCFMCGKDITGIIPFEYSDNTFCTTKCVREHRMKES